jgi:DNA polymerase III delta prime subunit
MNEKQLLINKYKPLLFNDFQISENLIQLLTQQIHLNKLTTIVIGNEGTGKTTLLQAIVREYYRDIPYDEYKNNILYINTLNEQGISYFRNDVKYFCQTCSIIPSKKKIIILDDIDILSESNQKIFINIVDKYSEQVHIVASCTYIQKITDGLKSRFMLIKLPVINQLQMKIIVEKIIHQEELSISEDAIDFLLHISKNKVNRLINYIEKIKLYGEHIDIHKAKQLCTNINTTYLIQYFHYLENEQLLSAIHILYELNDKGFSVIDILDTLIEYVKNMTDSTENGFTETEAYTIIHIICKYITVFYNIHEDEIELALLTNELFYTIYNEN